jgi:hypothetical protein
MSLPSSRELRHDHDGPKGTEVTVQNDSHHELRCRRSAKAAAVTPPAKMHQSR